ncbi:non-ribosomal peptide synthase/polyketide synthase [Bradyrhizobium sp. SZCCHNR31011]|uniref:non-ribosomal peptide synthase/polyketide synthase n=1 Tax=Bradyrhizobium sp. SZCCHNR31011 TaxID=3057453 RepID=UPI002916F960|nr:non-ribosomal peptide synthase/polyketide synthase [Bradyrhizobium sp. SZCCHNR31011]
MIENLLSLLRRDGVQIWSENGQVRYRAPRGVMTRERIDEVRARQQEITAFLEDIRSQNSELPPVVPRCTSELPLSFAQERLWFLEQLGSAGSSYHVAVALRLEGELDANALEQALSEIVWRHEMLRTRFETVSGRAVQIVDPAASYRLDVLDLSHLSRQEQNAELDRQSREHAAEPFDLSAAPPFRTRLIRLGSEQHLLLLAMHHIISDAWSSEVLIGEVTALYQAFRAGKPSPLEPLPVQYADYALWQRQWLRGNALERQLTYWTERLAGSPPQLDLPTDRSRRPDPTFAGAHHRISIAEATVTAVQRLARQENATLFMVLLSAFQLLLSRYCGQTDILVGSPVAGRRRHELEGLIGFFANILVLRANCSGQQSFRELLQQVKTTVLDAYAHQDLPFERLVEALQPDRDMARHPLVQVMFALQQAPFEGLVIPGLQLTPIPAENKQAKFDLTVHVYDAKRGLDVSIEYATELFDQTTIERLACHFAQLLDAIAANPDWRIRDLPLLSELERRELLVELNNTARRYPAERSLHEIFADQAVRYPNAIAVDDGGRRISYRELDAWSNGIAAGLRGLGIVPGAAVGLSGERSAGLIAGMLGILKAGGCYVPLDPSYPEERLTFMVRDAGLAAVVVAPGGCAPAELPSLRVADAPYTDAQPSAELGGEAVAYVMYTSGSTGLPKGIAVPHRAIARLAIGADYIALSPGDRVSHLSSPSFDAATFELWAALLNGCCIVIIDRDTALSPSRFAATVRERRLDSVFVTTALFNRLAQEAPDIFASVRDVLFGGEAADPQAVRTVLEHGAPRRLLNLYGPTEGTTFSTWMEVKAVPADARAIPIGRPIANSTCYVLDAALQPVPIGVAGELYVGGAGLAHGYWGRPALSAENFIPDPFGRAGGRLYATGDIVRRLADGAIEYLMRRDGQVKIRGFRIELSEIEAALRHHVGVAQAAVLARDTATGKQLVGYVAAKPDRTLSTDALRQHLQRSLPDYMVPVHIVVLDSLPLTANGKVDRAALPEPTPQSNDQRTMPTGGVQEVVSAIWCDVLQLSELGVDDNFFASGGHSLIAAQLIGRVNAVFQVAIPLRAVFEAPTIRMLATKIDEAQRQQTGLVAPALVPGPRVRTLPLSYAQEQLWFLDQVEDVGAAYNMAGALRLDGLLDGPALQCAFSEIVRRHANLRTRFELVDGRGVQVIDETQAFRIGFTDLGALEREERQIEARRLINDHARQPFDLRTGPLLRAMLVKLGEREHLLLVNMHHIISDGWSLRVLLRELGLLYRAEVEGRTASLPNLAVQYADYALWQRNWLDGDVLSRYVDHWRGQLAGAPTTLELPTDRPRPPVQSFAGATVPFVVSGELRAQLMALARREDATLYMVFLAAFSLLLSRYSGQQDILVGSPVAGRSRLELEGLTGMFVNMLVMRCELSGDPTFRDFLGRIKETALGAYSHQDIPFGKLVDALQPERVLSRHPLFQACLSFENTPFDSLELPGVAVSRIEADAEHQTAKFDLTLYVQEVPSGIECSLEYATDLFDRATIDRVIGHFLQLLDQIACKPDRALSEIDLLSEAERRRLIVDWNDTAASYPQDVCLHELFAAHAERRPDAVAAIWEDDELCYGELDRCANQLAHHLRGLGVGPDVIVGLCVERSLDMVVGVLGILKAGGAYLPLDPRYPAERLAYMLDDAKVEVLLTQEALLQRLPASDAIVVRLDVDGQAIAAHPETAPMSGVDADHLAYVIYTSGSTGKPKGVMISHRGIMNLADAQLARLPLEESDRILQFASISFDAAVWDLVMSWRVGAALVLAAQHELMPGEPLRELLLRQRISTVLLPPAALAALPVAEFKDLKTLLVGGEACSAELLRPWLAGRQVFNAYGPTEASVCTTMFRCDGAGRPPIGRPLPNTRSYVLDRRLQPVPVGVAGELHIGGIGVARGYLRRPGLTAERFLPNPFTPGERLYRTGDLVRWRADGELEFLGRLDSQVKLRGFRIELGEIEAALSAQDGVAQAAAVIREDGAGKRLAAYVVADPEASTDISELRRQLQQMLPDYMVPSAIVRLDRLPLSPNGKLDRNALPAPEWQGRGEIIAPRNATEEALVAIWREVLKRERVSVTDNFFELGGDSIQSIQVVARAKRAGLSLTARQVFEQQTIAALAAVAGHATAVTAEQGLVTGEVPLSPIQHWFFDQELAAPHHFNQAVLLDAAAAVTPGLVSEAMSHLLRHHDALRLRFHRQGESWRQLHGQDEAAVQLACEPIDLTELGAAVQPAALKKHADRLQASLDLADGPLLRAALFDLGEQGMRLLLIVHHLVVDGVSWRILLEDLATVLSTLQRGEPVRLAAKTTSFRVWAERLAAHAGSESLQRELAYWQGQPWAEASRLPRDHDGGTNRADTVRMVSVTLDAAQTRALLQDVPGVYHTQINDVLLTALVEACAEWTGQRRLLVALEGHGREELFAELDVSRTVGWFTSLFPVLLEVEGTSDAGAALKVVKEQLRAVPHRGIGYGLLRYLAGAAVPEVSPEISFNYLGQLDGSGGAGALRFAPEDVGAQQDGRNRRAHLIDVSAHVRDGCLQLQWFYSSELHEAATITALAEDHVAALRALIAHCAASDGGLTPSDIPLAGLRQDELDRVVASVGGPRQVEDIYPLSPTQQGMLFHSLYAPESAVYVISLACRLEGALDGDAFEQAWQTVVARHAVLRSAFVGQDLAVPLQVVLRAAKLPFVREDWRGLPAAEQEVRFEALQQAERSRGFDFASPPLLRLCLIRTGDNDYRLLWNSHHILFDGWSIPLLLDEVFAAYVALSRREAPQLIPLRPFRDYIAWLQRQDMAAAEAYWRQRLAGFGTPSSLGLGRPAASVLTEQSQDRYAEQACEIALGAIESFARRHRLTVNTLVQGAWALLLGRYGDSNDVVFGVTVSGRPAELPEVERTVGLFINTLPLRVALPEQANVLEFLGEVQARQSELTDYQYSPLAEVQRWSELPAATPLFESIVAFENYPAEMSALGGLAETIRISEVRPLERTNYPLTLQVTVGEQLSFRLIAERERFETTAVERLLQHLARLLGEIVADADRPLSALSLLSDAEQQQVVSAFNATAAGTPQGLLHEPLAIQAARTPDRIALRFADATLSYGELDRRANQLAHHLQGLGVGPDVVVGVLAERSLEMVVALLGILKAGGAYLPLDPSYPAERLAYMMDDAMAPVLLTQANLVERLAAGTASVVRLDADWPEIARHPDTAPSTSCTPANLAYVIYTSGSTGRPKGVMNAHRGIVNRLAWMQAAYQLTPDDRVLQKTPFGFDVSVWEFFWPLAHGAELVIARPGGHQDPAYLAELIEQARVSIVHFVPSMLQAFLEAADLKRCGSLRATICSGEALAVETQNRFLDLLPSCRLHNLYGPTEAAVDVSAWACRLEPAATQVPIGRPISNIQLYVLDHRLNPVPIGVAGELHIGGIGVARGYLLRPGLTAERFVPNPFTPGERLYRTGDLARWRSDGALDYLGRIDHQVKIRGFRIELGEIEAALSAHAEVEQAAVVVREDSGERRLVGYVTTRDDARCEADALRRHLQATLPDHMVPSAIVRLDRLPLSPNGKLDRNALPAPEWQGRGEIIAPRNATEEALVAIWREVLKRERVSVTDNFFELGGDSIQSIQVVARAKRAGLSLTARQVFEQQTIAALAAVAGHATAVTAEQGLVTGEVPLSPIQHWFFDQELAAPHHFNQAVLLDAAAAVTPGLVSEAMSHLLRHHDALRLRFHRQGESWRQLHGQDEAAVQLACEPIDLTELGAAVQPAALKKHADRLQASLDLADGPLLCAGLFDLGSQGRRLLLIVHHLVVDGVSWRILLEDLATVLSALQQGEPVRLAAKTTSFRAWAERLVVHAGSESLQRELAYWQGQPWAEASRLPRDHEGGTNHADTVRMVSVTLDAAQTRALLQDVPGVYHTQINDVLLTALVEACAEWIGQRRLLVALEGHGREELFAELDVSRTVGWFTSLFPVLLDLGAASDPGAALKAVKEQLRAVPHRGIGYGLLRYLAGAAVPEVSPEISFNYLGQLDGSGGAGALRFAPEDVGAQQDGRNRRAHLIDVSAYVRDGRLQLQWVYSPASHDASTIEALAAGLVAYLQALIEHCEISDGGFTLSDFPLLQGHLTL